MGIEPSNYYKYREGDGNPTCKTIDKILEVVMDEQPEIMVRMLEEELESEHVREVTKLLKEKNLSVEQLKELLGSMISEELVEQGA